MSVTTARSSVIYGYRCLLKPVWTILQSSRPNAKQGIVKWIMSVRHQRPIQTFTLCTFSRGRKDGYVYKVSIIWEQRTTSVSYFLCGEGGIAMHYFCTTNNLFCTIKCISILRINKKMTFCIAAFCVFNSGWLSQSCPSWRVECICGIFNRYISL